MKLQFLDDNFSVCQLPGDSQIPTWANGTPSFISRCEDELSIIVKSSQVPPGTKAEDDYQCFRVADDLAFDIIGVIADISHQLASRQIPILSVSTYNTDYFLIPLSRKQDAVVVLEQSGHQFQN